MPTYLIERCQNTFYMSNMDMRSNQRWSTVSNITLWHHFHLTVTQICQNLTQLRWCNGWRLHWYAYVPHWKVLQHFIHVQYGCEKQSKVVYSLNHNIMASFLLDSHPELLKTDPTSAVYRCKGALKCLCTSSKDAKPLHKCPIWMWTAVKRWSTVSNITLWHPFCLAVTQNCKNLTQLQQCNGVRLH
jgi:hypothetical protein